MKTAIFTDPLMGKGGATYLTIELANNLNADIITSGFNKDLRSEINKNIKVIDIGNILVRLNYSLGYLFEAPIRFLFCKKYDYDVNIFIGTFSIFASHKEQNNFWLCLTPNRIMYDLNNLKLNDTSYLKRLVYRLHIFLFQKIDYRVARNNFKKIISQNINIKNRVRKYYNIDSEIIYSSVNTSRFKFNSFGDYYLTVSRLVPEKRIDLIAKAFTKMLSKKLIIVGEGPEKEKIKKIINKFDNITLLNNVNDEELIELYSNCLATIYMPLNEDFGLVPIEGMASGKACIAVDEGGCRETVIPGKTGILIKPSITAIISSIEKYNINYASKMKSTCIEWAKKFDIQSYLTQWKILINK